MTISAKAQEAPLRRARYIIIVGRATRSNVAMDYAYAQARGRDIAARAVAIDLFNRVTRAPDAVSQALRQFGLKAIHDVAPLRRGVMRAGMGPPG